MIDFHTHILPSVDDGARDLEMSLAMLKKAYNDGTRVVVATSHIYTGDESDIDKFISNRNKSYERLLDAIERDGGKFPEIRLGAEVYVRSHIGRYESISRLAIGGTDYILLEMPMNKAWSQAHYEAIYNLTTLGLKPIIAHIDRYMPYRNEFNNLKSLGAVFQVNADAFLHKSMRPTLLKLFYDDYVHILGSDMHNTDDRQSNLKEAYDIIGEKFGAEFAKYLAENAKLLINNEKIKKQQLPKLGFFDKLKL